MPKKKTQPPDTVLPNGLEEHLGEIWDPRGHDETLASAQALLLSFVDAMKAGHLPAHTLEQVQDAVGILGRFAGYPREAHETEMFLESSLASSSYKTVAQILPSFIEDMNNRIKKRAVILSARESNDLSAPTQRIDDCEIPF